MLRERFGGGGFAGSEGPEEEEDCDEEAIAATPLSKKVYFTQPLGPRKWGNSNPNDTLPTTYIHQRKVTNNQRPITFFPHRDIESNHTNGHAKRGGAKTKP